MKKPQTLPVFKRKLGAGHKGCKYRFRILMVFAVLLRRYFIDRAEYTGKMIRRVVPDAIRDLADFYVGI